MKPFIRLHASKTLLAAALGMTALVAHAQPADAPWPMLRFDRWGTAKQPVGPDPVTLSMPWVERVLSPGELISHPPAIGANGIAYYGSWISNRLRKVDTLTGAVLGAFDTLEWVKSTPAIGDDGTLYINVPRTNGTIAGRLYAVDPDTMQAKWFVTTTQSSANNDYDNPSPNIGPDGSILTGGSNGIFYKVSPGGVVEWSRSGLSTIKFSPVLTRDDTKVIVASTTRVTALNYSDGTIAWQTTFPSTMGAPAVAPDGTIVCGSDSGIVYGIDPVTGLALWSQQTLSIVRACAAFDGDRAYIGSFDNRLYCFRTTDGAKLWTAQTNQQLMHGPLVGWDGMVYSSGQGCEITKVTPNGQIVWQVNGQRQLRGGMAMDDGGYLYIPVATPSGCVLKVTQKTFETAPANLTLARGQLVSGGISDLAEVDQSYYQVMNGAVMGMFDPPIQIVMDAVAPSVNIAKLDLAMVVGASTPNLMQRVEAFNWSANAYYVLDMSPTPTSDTPFNLSLTGNIARFVNSTGTVRFRVSYSPAGPTIGLRYTTRWDLARFTISPGFAP